MIQERVVLVNFSASTWAARKFDKRITREVAESHGVNEDAGRYTKVLIGRDAVKKYESIAGEARQFHRSITLPWLDNGTRMCPNGLITDYTSGLNSRESKFREAVEEFWSLYPYLKQDAQMKGNGFYNEEDYPSESKLRRKFDWVVTILPMPATDDFRVKLNETEEKRIRQDLEKAISKNLENATRELWGRVYEMVDRIYSTTKVPDKIFHDTMLSKAQELCDLLPKLNITDDPDLEETRKKIEKDILVFSGDDLRKYKDTRKEVSNIAKELVDETKGKIDALEEVWG